MAQTVIYAIPPACIDSVSPCVATPRSDSTSGVRGSASIMGCNASGISSLGQNVPDKNIMGNETALPKALAPSADLDSVDMAKPMAKNVMEPINESTSILV